MRTTSHLTGGVWYLDCAPSFTPSFEIELRKSEAIGESEMEMVDLQFIEDENEKAKNLKRCIEEDRKKTLRIKEVEERADQKEWRNYISHWRSSPRREKKYEPRARR